jgi:hypothetical protein
MASCIGAARRRHATVRPLFALVTNPASDKTSRCFMMAGSDIEKGFASSLTDRSCRSLNRANKALRVGSASAANVRSRFGF